jgi:hypothetical protein
LLAGPQSEIGEQEEGDIDKEKEAGKGNSDLGIG